MHFFRFISMDAKTELNLKEFPLAWTLQTDKLNSYCSYCLKSGGNSLENVHLMRCAKCKILHYCDSNCQKTDWISSHKNECKRFCRALSRSRPIPDDFLRLFARIFDIEASRNFLPVDKSDPNQRTFDDLLSHEKKISKLEFKQFEESFCEFLPKDDEDEKKLTTKYKKSFAEYFLLPYYGKLKVNAFGIKNEELKSLGIGLYLNLSRLDHSCVPNARIFFKGREAFVIGVHEGGLQNCESYAEICHSYIDNLAPLNERRDILLESYYFYCHCDGCDDKNAERNEIMESVCCDTDGCNGYVSLISGENKTCKLCGNPLKDINTAKMVLDLTKEMLNKLSQTFTVDAERKFEICTKTAAMQTGSLYEYNIYKMRTIRIAFESCVELNRWTDAAVYGENLLHVYRKYLSPNDPYLFVYAKNLAVVYANANLREQASAILNEFKGNFDETFGEQSKFVKNVDEIFKRVSLQ